MNKKLVLAFSGGMDSTVLLFKAASEGYREIHTVTFDYGQRHRREIQCIPDQIRNLQLKYPDITVTNKILDVRYLKDISPTSSLTNNEIDNPNISKIAGDAQPVSYVPFRNQMFLTICCAYGESLKVDTVWYGAAEADSLAGYWDGDNSFVKYFNKLISLNRETKITIEAPLISLSKAEIIREGVLNGVSFKDTWTCYSDREDGLADATTPSSSLRVKGFIDAGYRDPVRYLQQEQIDRIYELNNCKEL
jgi:7-cyano-7-deazaguanine synthase